MFDTTLKYKSLQTQNMQQVRGFPPEKKLTINNKYLAFYTRNKFKQKGAVHLLCNPRNREGGGDRDEGKGRGGLNKANRDDGQSQNGTK